MTADRPITRQPTVRFGDPGMHVDIRVAALTWLGCWLGGNTVGAAVLAAAGQADGDAPTPIWAVAIAATCLWLPMMAALTVLSRRSGTGDFRADYAVGLRPFDLVGVPIGVLSQLVLVPVLYLPLEQLWPSAFDGTDRERNARDLYESAQGGWLVVLIVIVVIGAPLVEELVYRGLLQGAFVRRLDDTVARDNHRGLAVDAGCAVLRDADLLLHQTNQQARDRLSALDHASGGGRFAPVIGDRLHIGSQRLREVVGITARTRGQKY